MLKITVIGNITSDFELRTKPGDDIPYAIIRIASDRRYRDREGNKLTDFVSVKVRGNLAELCVEHLGKGDKIAAIDIVQQQETAGVGSLALDALPARIIEAQSTEVDAVAGATVSSTALKDAVNNALAQVK